MKPTSEQESRAARVIEEKQISIDEWLASRPKEARGKTCRKKDMSRLTAQGLVVYGFVRDLGKRTLREISSATGVPEASASARLREIRAYLKIGNRGTVIREEVPGTRGLYTYEVRLTNYPGVA